MPNAQNIGHAEAAGMPAARRRVRMRNLAAETPAPPQAEPAPNPGPRPLPFSLRIGADLVAEGVTYRVWAPDHPVLHVDITAADGSARRICMDAGGAGGEGYHHAHDPEGRAGDRYFYAPSGAPPLPDPASRYQPEGVFGRSMVVDGRSFEWRDQRWERPAFRDLVLYELHLGTFTPEGTFRSAIQRLPELRDLGVNAVEIMPVADFPGGRNWGYDGVCLYAPAHAYGAPDDLRALVDAAHEHGIAVILDVVYNHVGPDGCTLAAFATRYFDSSRQTPWGRAFNFDGPGSEAVREFFAGNPAYWMEEFHMDGFRLDATHAMHDTSERHILAEIASRIHARGGYVIAEDERNYARLIEPVERGGYGLDAVWADDFHHSVRVGQTREQHAYLQNFSGTLEETTDTLMHGWRFRGQILAPGHGPRGTAVAHVPPSCLIHCISNHDQSGNRAFGERVNASIPAESYRAISMLLCLSPYTPMLFMGQEWAATTPFLFFTDHKPELGRLVTEGRRREFAGFPEFNDPAKLEQIPDPQSEATFLRSKLNWEEAEAPPHAGVLELYRECLQLRHAKACLRPVTREGWQAGTLQRGVGFVRFDEWVSSYLLLFHLWPEDEPLEMSLGDLPWRQPGIPWEFLMSSNEARFGGGGCAPGWGDAAYVFGGAETLLLRSRG